LLGPSQTPEQLPSLRHSVASGGCLVGRSRQAAPPVRSLSSLF